VESLAKSAFIYIIASYSSN